MLLFLQFYFVTDSMTLCRLLIQLLLQLLLIVYNCLPVFKLYDICMIYLIILERAVCSRLLVLLYLGPVLSVTIG